MILDTPSNSVTEGCSHNIEYSSEMRKKKIVKKKTFDSTDNIEKIKEY